MVQSLIVLKYVNPAVDDVDDGFFGDEPESPPKGKQTPNKKAATFSDSDDDKPNPLVAKDDFYDDDSDDAPNPQVTKAQVAMRVYFRDFNCC